MLRKPMTLKKTTHRRTVQPIELLFAGFGGQGIMFMGKLIAQAALDSGKHVTWMPSYGAEVRGGTAYSMTKISDTEIATPIVLNPDSAVIMNKPSMVRYADAIKPGGIVVFNTSLIDTVPARKDITRIGVPMTALAVKLGNIRCANMIAIGVLLKRSSLVGIRTVTAALRAAFAGRDDLFALNKKALEKGFGIR